jgi:hypothetical protein
VLHYCYNTVCFRRSWPTFPGINTPISWAEALCFSERKFLLSEKHTDTNIRVDDKLRYGVVWKKFPDILEEHGLHIVTICQFGGNFQQFGKIRRLRFQSERRLKHLQKRRLFYSTVLYLNEQLNCDKCSLYHWGIVRLHFPDEDCLQILRVCLSFFFENLWTQWTHLFSLFSYQKRGKSAVFFENIFRLFGRICCSIMRMMMSIKFWGALTASSKTPQFY